MRLWEKIKEPFIAIAILYDESKRLDLDGDWERYYRNKEERRRKRRNETNK